MTSGTAPRQPGSTKAKLSVFHAVLVPLLIVGAGLIVAWEAAVRAFDIIPQLLPPPSSVVAQIIRQPELFVEATATTLVNMITGLMLAASPSASAPGWPYSIRHSCDGCSTQSS